MNNRRPPAKPKTGTLARAVKERELMARHAAEIAAAKEVPPEPAATMPDAKTAPATAVQPGFSFMDGEPQRPKTPAPKGQTLGLHK